MLRFFDRITGLSGLQCAGVYLKNPVHPVILSKKNEAHSFVDFVPLCEKKERERT